MSNWETGNMVCQLQWAAGILWHVGILFVASCWVMISSQGQKRHKLGMTCIIHLNVICLFQIIWFIHLWAHAFLRWVSNLPTVYILYTNHESWWGIYIAYLLRSLNWLLGKMAILHSKRVLVFLLSAYNIPTALSILLVTFLRDYSSPNTMVKCNFKCPDY